MAPVAPFIAEEVYLNLKSKDDPLSVHLTDYPELTDELRKRRDAALEKAMALAQKIVSIIRDLRNDKQIRVRQPLSRVLIYSPVTQDRNDINKMADIIKEEVNIKKIEFIDDDTSIVERRAKPNFKVLGAKVGKLMGQLKDVITGFNNDKIRELESKGFIHVFIDNHELKLEKEDVVITSEAKGDFAVHAEDQLTIALDLTLTPELIEEGFAREFVNRVQNLRKEMDFEVTDHIKIEVQGLPEEKKMALERQKSYIQNETLADHLIFGEIDTESAKEVKIDDLKFKINLVKI